MNEISVLNSAVCYKFVTSVTHANLETRPHDCTLAPAPAKKLQKAAFYWFCKIISILFAPVKIVKKKLNCFKMNIDLSIFFSLFLTALLVTLIDT